MSTVSVGSAAAVVAVLAVAAFVLVKRRLPTLFDLMYFLYTRTPFGPWYHQRQLRDAHMRAAHVQVRPEDHTLLPQDGAGQGAGDGFRVIPVPHLQDNYAYLIVHSATQTAVAVDAADPDAIAASVRLHGVTLLAILTTHRHMDHSGGNIALKALFPAAQVYGSTRDKVPGITHDVSDGQVLCIGAAFHFLVIGTPAHTHGHVAYALLNRDTRSPMALFSGDALFVAGTGKVFEGSHETMLKSILHVLAVVPDSCLMFPGHEYALVNTAWAVRMDPQNEHLRALHERAAACMKKRIPLPPTSILEEKLCSPFFRTHLPPFAAKDGSLSSQLEVFTALRNSKDAFKPSL